MQAFSVCAPRNVDHWSIRAGSSARRGQSSARPHWQYIRAAHISERRRAALFAYGELSFHYGNSHWTVLDANTYMDWNNPSLREWLAADPAAAQSAVAHRAVSPTRLQFFQGALQ